MEEIGVPWEKHHYIRVGSDHRSSNVATSTNLYITIVLCAKYQSSSVACSRQPSFSQGWLHTVCIGYLEFIILPMNKTLIGDSCLRMFNTLYKKVYLLQLPMIYGLSGMVVGKFMSHDFSGSQQGGSRISS